MSERPVMIGLSYETAVMVKRLNSRFTGADTWWRSTAIRRSPSDVTQLNCAALPSPTGEGLGVRVRARRALLACGGSLIRPFGPPSPGGRREERAL
jgi:hypothetical protein